MLKKHSRSRSLTSPDGATSLISKSVINITFTDGNKYQDLSKRSMPSSLVFDAELKAYITCAEESEVEKLKLDWNFPKTHLWKHVLHGPLKDTYHRRTNGKDIADCKYFSIDHHKFASKLLRERVNTLDEHCRLNGHVKLGSPVPPLDILGVESRGQMDRPFQSFRRKFSEFINNALPTYGHQLTSWVTFPGDFKIHEHRYLKVNYESAVDWRQNTDHLRCNPKFHGRPRFDHALIQLTAEETAFVQLIFMFRCHISNLGPFEFALVQPYTARVGPRRTDSTFKLTRVKAVPRSSSIFVPLKSFIRRSCSSDMFSANETHMRISKQHACIFTKDASNPPPNSDEKYPNNTHAFFTKDASKFTQEYQTTRVHFFYQRRLKPASKLDRRYPNNTRVFFTKDASNQPPNLHEDIQTTRVHFLPKTPQTSLQIRPEYPNNTCAFFTKDASAQNCLALTVSGSDLDAVRTVLAVPGPDAQMHDVRKALAVAQQAYHATRSELRVLKKQYLTLSSAIPARSRNRMLKKTSPLDSSITHQGQKYTLFSHFWVINGLFPTSPQPANVDPRAATRWSSPDAKLKGAMAELYQIIPKDLHTSMETYPRFGSLFRSAVSSERSNILHSIKDCAGVIFSPFKLDPSIFADQPSKKQDNKDLLVLLKRNGEGDYIRLAPVLFAKPNAMSADDFLKSPVLVKIIRVEVYGKAILGGKTRGHPKGRGLRMGAQSVTEGMIAGAAILARFLLTHDTELTATGAETKIDYQKDYDFYLEHLFKSSPWAIGVMEYFNKEVFNTRAALLSAPASVVPSASIPRTWEDDLLEELDNPVARAPFAELFLFSAHPRRLFPISLLFLQRLQILPPRMTVSLSQHQCQSASHVPACLLRSYRWMLRRLNQQVEKHGVRGRISAQPVPAAVPDVPKPKHISTRSKKPTTR
ncbi:uncharacterized protein F5147DRAFT_779906 [Suillus discolor]|uniref:Uncharacterized protein n=2 Tax=Suillineae TaxID=227332 RepID=A0A9P7EVX4_9AGAM|nr:uncharacterized protein F5147DRAFT_779906 [Suillus discolor]KAG2091630.1 hypothetical protein F5147DRAFT_779906 [Suillus discolor]